MSVRVALIVGSLREGSYSRAIGLEMKALAAPELELDLIEIGDLPLYNQLDWHPGRRLASGRLP